jgi:hypothetical protein
VLLDDDVDFEANVDEDEDDELVSLTSVDELCSKPTSIKVPSRI